MGGTFPYKLFAFNKLLRLDLSGCGLIGTIPDLAQYFIDVYIAEEQALNPQPEVDGVGEFDGDEPTDIFGLQQAEKAKAKKAKAA